MSDINLKTLDLAYTGSTLTGFNSKTDFKTLLGFLSVQQTTGRHFSSSSSDGGQRENHVTYGSSIPCSFVKQRAHM